MREEDFQKKIDYLQEMKMKTLNDFLPLDKF